MYVNEEIKCVLLFVGYIIDICWDLISYKYVLIVSFLYIYVYL